MVERNSSLSFSCSSASFCSDDDSSERRREEERGERRERRERREERGEWEEGQKGKREGGWESDNLSEHTTPLLHHYPLHLES